MHPRVRKRCLTPCETGLLDTWGTPTNSGELPIVELFFKYIFTVVSVFLNFDSLMLYFYVYLLKSQEVPLLDLDEYCKVVQFIS
jgi:hypothetical protein